MWQHIAAVAFTRAVHDNINSALIGIYTNLCSGDDGGKAEAGELLQVQSRIGPAAMTLVWASFGLLLLLGLGAYMMASSIRITHGLVDDD
jgi:hypothetical protein